MLSVRLYAFSSITISPFPLLKSLHFSLSSPFERVDGAATASLLSVCETFSLWPAQAHLDGWPAEEGEAHLTPCRPCPGAPHWLEIYERGAGSNLISCSDWKSDPPHILSCIFLLPREVPWGQAEAADFYTLVNVWEATVGCGPTQDARWLVQALSPQWAGDRVRPPSLALSGSVWLGVWMDTRRGRGGMAISLCFSVFPVPPAFTSPSVLSPYSRPLYPENSVSLSVIIGIFVK